MEQSTSAGIYDMGVGWASDREMQKELVSSVNSSKKRMLGSHVRSECNPDHDQNRGPPSSCSSQDRITGQDYNGHIKYAMLVFQISHTIIPQYHSTASP